MTNSRIKKMQRQFRNTCITCCIAIAPFVAVAQETPLKLWYDKPAQQWTDALPIGNGHLGAMIYGGPAEEHIQFNESTLWTGRPRQYAHDGAVQYLQPIR